MRTLHVYHLSFSKHLSIFNEIENILTREENEIIDTFFVEQPNRNTITQRKHY